jgi:hypothetical protein
MCGGFLDVMQRDAGIGRGSDDRMSERVRGDGLGDPPGGGLGDSTRVPPTARPGFPSWLAAARATAGRIPAQLTVIVATWPPKPVSDSCPLKTRRRMNSGQVSGCYL